MSEQKDKLDMERLANKIKEAKDLKSLRMEIALALQHKAKTEDIYEILDFGLKRSWELGYCQGATDESYEVEESSSP